jgi:hypothetical protein
MIIIGLKTSPTMIFLCSLRVEARKQMLKKDRDFSLLKLMRNGKIKI